MLYDYTCSNCDHKVIDYYQSIKDDPITFCEKCNTHSLQRIITGGLGSFYKEAKTIGQLADRNWSKMGSYKQSEIEASRKESATKETSFLDQAGKATRHQINKMTVEQKKKYITTGET